MHSAWHDANVYESANFGEARCDCFVVSPQEVEFACPDNGRRVLTENCICRLTWIQLIVILLLFEVCGVQFERASQSLGRITPISFKRFQLLPRHLASLIGKHTRVNEEGANLFEKSGIRGLC